MQKIEKKKTYSSQSYKPSIYTLSFSTRKILSNTPLFWVLIFVLFGLIVALVTTLISQIKINNLKKMELIDKNFIDQTLKLFANTIEAKDVYTKGHSLRVSLYSKEIAKQIGLNHDEQMIIYYSALLHDIGKIGIPDAILNKTGRLNTEETAIMRSHANKSADILLDFTSIPNISNTVQSHHEWYNGKGYPNGLCGNDIPLYSRIICLADSFDAMTTNRCYKAKMTNEQIIDELNRCSGTQFDPDLVPFMINIFYSPLYSLLTS